MAVFIALFFQVLFVFFAMAINVGLVIHDKINLQNAVDIAAYYGAAKQAEALNQIAHINYQMRQNYKLLAWRYRVLGTIGLSGHPYTFTAAGPFGGEVPATGIPPSICAVHGMWREYKIMDPKGGNLCQYSSVTIPNLPLSIGGTGIVPLISTLRAHFTRTNAQIKRNCLEGAVINWMLAARWLVHYRADGAMRKQMIRKIANNMSSPDFVDLRNESVEQGVRNTLTYNLTNSNRAGLGNFQYFNSMTQEACNAPSKWLPEVRINPLIVFTDFTVQGTNNNCSSGQGGVFNRPMPRAPGPGGLTNLPSAFNLEPQLVTLYADALAQLSPHWQGEPNNDFHSSIGFEKNPWCMVYSGVTATTQVRKPFSPFGSVTLQARGFAKPFGGRIGPWYGKSWPQGSPNSQAPSRNQMVDPLLPSRDVQGSAASVNSNEELANYSRFPGDTLGLTSLRAIGAMRSQFRTRISTPGLATPTLSLTHYDHLGGTAELETLGDSLARDTVLPANQRAFEWAATAPDLFDAIYYSIEPKYFNNYFTSQTTNGGALFPQNEQIYDLGSAKSGNQSTPVPVTSQLDIQANLNNANLQYEQAYEPIVRDWRNLLTSWHQKAAVDYTLDPSKFGRCQHEVTNPSFPTTGNCIGGGRTGYSVKNVSRDYLLSGDHQLSGSEAGPILNPPSF